MIRVWVRNENAEQAFVQWIDSFDIGKFDNSIVIQRETDIQDNATPLRLDFDAVPADFMAPSMYAAFQKAMGSFPD